MLSGRFQTNELYSASGPRRGKGQNGDWHAYLEHLNWRMESCWTIVKHLNTKEIQNQILQRKYRHLKSEPYSNNMFIIDRGNLSFRYLIQHVRIIICSSYLIRKYRAMVVSREYYWHPICPARNKNVLIGSCTNIVWFFPPKDARCFNQKPLVLQTWLQCTTIGTPSIGIKHLRKVSCENKTIVTIKWVAVADGVCDKRG